MKTCIIFCAGGFDGLAEPIGADDLVIAADGGLIHTQSLGIRPHIILGDFDSLGYTPQGSAVFPVEKDDTDAMLAVRRGLKEGLRRFVLYGSLDGPRLDHTIANLQTLLYLSEQGAQGFLVGQSHTVSVVKNGTLFFPSHFKGILSVFCLGRTAHGVTLKGLHYPLENGTLCPHFPLGVSNRFTGTDAAVTVTDGTLLTVCDSAYGLPQHL